MMKKSNINCSEENINVGHFYMFLHMLSSIFEQSWSWMIRTGTASAGGRRSSELFTVWTPTPELLSLTSL